MSMALLVTQHAIDSLADQNGDATRADVCALWAHALPIPRELVAEVTSCPRRARSSDQYRRSRCGTMIVVAEPLVPKVRDDGSRMGAAVRVVTCLALTADQIDMLDAGVGA